MEAVIETYILLALVVGGALALAYRASSIVAWTAAVVAAVAAVHWLGNGVSPILWLALAVPAAILNIKALRRPLLSKHLLTWFRSVLPPMSATEKSAIDAGTTWWDGELFTGRPNWDQMLAFPKPELTSDEQAFIDGPAEELCRMLNDWQIVEELNDFPDDVWRYMKENRFFGLIIPKEHGGLGFTPRAQSEVVMKIATRSVSAAITVMVPNSLGPGELIMHYGTQEQKNHYLPRLAVGTDIPAFALTNPYAGSDAGAMPDVGVACVSMHDGKETVGFRVNWQKRYITLSPVCTVLGLAFKATDPDGLLGDQNQLGITCALVPTNTPGVTIGARHAPGGAFPNGPNSGEDVFIPMDWIIGGREQVGHGWKMLMNCLSVGRAISLPALGAAAGKLTSLTTGAYSRLREQFNIPIGQFEGIEEVLARIGGTTYRMDAGRLMTAVALNLGERPSVLSAILKYHNTEGMRTVINDAMDVHGGRAVCHGPRNYLQNAYRSIPVAITVEGANILTRSMIIFGQGAIRCHPYVLKEMRAAADSNEQSSLKTFDDTIFRHIGFTISNAVRALLLGLTGAHLARTPNVSSLLSSYRQLSRMSAAFTFVADVAMLVLGGELKRKERLSARLGDVLSHLYLSSAVLKRFEDNGAAPAELPLAEWAVQDSLFIMQSRLNEILDNFPSKLLGRAIKLLIFPLGRRYVAPGDKLDHRVAQIMLAPSEVRNRLTSGVFVDRTHDDPVGLMELLLENADELVALKRNVTKHVNKPLVGPTADVSIAEAVADNVISEPDAAKLREFLALLDDVIRVDSFPPNAQTNADRLVSGAVA